MYPDSMLFTENWPLYKCTYYAIIVEFSKFNDNNIVGIHIHIYIIIQSNQMSTWPQKCIQKCIFHKVWNLFIGNKDFEFSWLGVTFSIICGSSWLNCEKSIISNTTVITWNQSFRRNIWFPYYLFPSKTWETW